MDDGKCGITNDNIQKQFIFDKDSSVCKLVNLY